MIYLATPHSTTPHGLILQVHECVELKAWREQAAIYTMAYYQAQGWNVYSPIAHNNQGDEFFRKHLKLAGNSEYEHYQRWDEHMITLAETIWVLTIPGWQHSRGVRSEVKFGRARGLSINFIQLPDPVQEVIGPSPYKLRIEAQPIPAE